MMSYGQKTGGIEGRLRQFFFPSLTRRFAIRVVIVAVTTFVLFHYVCIPVRCRGESMEPTYRNGSVNLCFRLRYVFTKPRRHDVATVRFVGTRVMLLKRVVATEGETLEFRNGKLFVDDKAIDEPYVRNPCDWNMPPRKVSEGCFYFVGDNRSMPIDEHVFGETSGRRIIGAPLW